MFIKTVLLLLPLALLSQEIVWDSSSETRVSKESYETAMREYVETTYPDKVTSYKANQKEQKNYTVTMNGLMWQDNKEAVTDPKNWQTSKAYCEELNFAGFSDWRQPHLHELASISDKGRPERIKMEFKNNMSNGYWSSKEEDKKASVFSFLTVREHHFPKTMRYYTRCVRKK